MPFRTLAERKNIQLAYPFEEKRLAKWIPPFLVQPKLDGWRCRAVWLKEKETYRLLSSTEHVIESAPHIEEELERWHHKTGRTDELDGELYIHGLSFDEIESIVSRTRNLHPDFRMTEFHVFDLPSELEQHRRIRELSELFFSSEGFETLRLVDTHLVNDLEGVMFLLRDYHERGYEGIIVREKDASYSRKRSTGMMKFKPKKKDLYRIVGFQEEVSLDDVPKGQLGVFICEKDGNEFKISASALTRDEKRTYWGARERMIGRHLEVYYQNVTATGAPRFVGRLKVL